MSSLTLSLIQTRLYWEDRAANLQHLEEKINSITAATELVVLPEMFSTGFSMNPRLLAETLEGDTLQWMKRIASNRRIILTGSFMVKEGAHYFNRLVWMLPNGQYGHYDKRHLFAFAGEDEQYTPGSKRFIASVKGWRVLLLICYDLRFPVWSRQAMSANANGDRYPEYDLIVYVANWPERRSHAWKTLLQARAIENQCYVVGVNRVGEDGNGIDHSGDSMLVDPMGTVVATASGQEWIHTQTIHKDQLEEVRRNLPFLSDADSFHIDP